MSQAYIILSKWSTWIKNVLWRKIKEVDDVELLVTARMQCQVKDFNWYVSQAIFPVSFLKMRCFSRCLLWSMAYHCRQGSSRHENRKSIKCKCSSCNPFKKAGNSSELAEFDFLASKFWKSIAMLRTSSVDFKIEADTWTHQIHRQLALICRKHQRALALA